MHAQAQHPFPTPEAGTIDAVTIAATGQIVAAMCSYGYDGLVGDLITDVRRALSAPLTDPKPEPVELVPAVPIRQSVKPDYIVCLEDGKKFKSLKRHLRTVYNLTPEDYRAKWGLPADYPMVAPNYSATRSQLAKASGLGTKK